MFFRLLVCLFICLFVEWMISRGKSMHFRGPPQTSPTLHLSRFLRDLDGWACGGAPTWTWPKAKRCWSGHWQDSFSFQDSRSCELVPPLSNDAFVWSSLLFGRSLCSIPFREQNSMVGTYQFIHIFGDPERTLPARWHFSVNSLWNNTQIMMGELGSLGDCKTQDFSIQRTKILNYNMFGSRRPWKKILS